MTTNQLTSVPRPVNFNAFYNTSIKPIQISITVKNKFGKIHISMTENN
jgi:hypothetical protein